MSTDKDFNDLFLNNVNSNDISTRSMMGSILSITIVWL